MNMNIRIVVSIVCLSTVLACGCKKNEETAPPPQKTEIAPVNTPQAQPEPTKSQQTQPPAFSASLPTALAGKTLTPGGIVFLDSINKHKPDSTVALKGKNTIDIQGWAINDSNKSVPDMVFIELSNVKNGEKYYSAINRVIRPDIAKGFNVPAYNNAGISLQTDITVIPPGEYLVNVIQVDNGNPIITSKGYKINKTK